MDARQEQEIFNDVVKLSTLLREGQITLYSIDPLGSADFGGRAFRWEVFTKGISKPSQAEWGDLALQVISTQAVVLRSPPATTSQHFIKQCFADTQANSNASGLVVRGEVFCSKRLSSCSPK